MRRISGSVLFLALVLVSGCSGSVKVMDPLNLEQYPATDSGTNELVFMQSRLVIPDGWSFERAEAGTASAENGVQSAQLFRMDDRKGNVSGAFHYTSIPGMTGEISPELLMEYYSKNVITDVRHKEAHPVSIDGEPSYVVTGEKKGEGWDFMSALVPEAKAFNLIMLLSNPGYLNSNPGLAYRIFGSYEYEEAGAARRIIPGQIKFTATDGAWGWGSDWHADAIEGYLLVDDAKKNTPLEAIGVGIASVASIAQLDPVFAKLGETVTVPEFDVTVPVGATELTGRAVATKNAKGLVSLYYFLPSGGKNHVIMPCHAEGAVEQPPATLHEWPLLRDVLTKYLSL